MHRQSTSIGFENISPIAEHVFPLVAILMRGNAVEPFIPLWNKGLYIVCGSNSLVR